MMKSCCKTQMEILRRSGKIVSAFKWKNCYVACCKSFFRPQKLSFTDTQLSSCLAGNLINCCLWTGCAVEHEKKFSIAQFPWHFIQILCDENYDYFQRTFEIHLDFSGRNAFEFSVP